MKFVKENTGKGIQLPEAVLKLSGLNDEEKLALISSPEILLMLRNRMTAKELLTAVISLRMAANELMGQLEALLPGECGDCGDSCIGNLCGIALSVACSDLAGQYGLKASAEAEEARDTADAVCDELFVRGVCIPALLEHYINEDKIYGK